MVKRIAKPISVILMLFILAFCFSGCASVRMSVVANADGTINEIVTIELDEVAVVNAGYSVALLKQDIKTRSIDEAQNICDNFKFNIDLTMASDITEETKDILLEYKNSLDVVYADWENNSFTVGLRFKNVDVYNYFYGITETNKVVYQKEEHFLYTKVYQQRTTKYVAYSSLFNKLKDFYSANYVGLINSETNQLAYTYVSDIRREHSDADYINKINNNYYHTWLIDSENINEPIIIYYNIANAGNCILLCLAITAGLTAIIFFIVYFKNKLKNNKKLKK